MAPADGPLPRVQNFKVHKLLGKGSYGKVYKVQRESDDKYYALKETDLGALNHLERMDAVNEVRLLVSMNHPSVIRYHEAFLNGNKLCVVMEYAPFGDLRYYISKGQRLNAPFPEEAIWRIFLQLCKGLQALHAAHIIHRDIKPANIFLCQNDLLKIGDLGVAKALNKMDFAKTQIGTPVYMAPEVWSGKLYSYSSDLWSLGCVLYEMMMFKVPIEGRSMQELKVRVSAGRYTPIPAGKYSPELVAFCHSLLSLDPKRRPSPESILSSTGASKWLKVLPTPSPSQRWSENGGPSSVTPVLGNHKMINTIVVPRDIRQLPKVLPPPSYDKPIVSPKEIPSSRDLPSPKDLASARDQGPAAALEAAKQAPARANGFRPVPSIVQPKVAIPAAYKGYYPPAGLPSRNAPAGLPPLQAGVQVRRQNSVEQLAPGLRPGPRRVSCS